jgi:hypothetical protein
MSKSSKEGSDIFTRAALERIVRKAKGNPRSINILCDNALITGFGSGEKKVSFRTAGEIIADMEGRTPSGFPGWATASIGLFLFLAAGFWIYTIYPFAPPQPPNNPVFIRLESQVGSAQGPENVSAGQGKPAGIQTGRKIIFPTREE